MSEILESSHLPFLDVVDDLGGLHSNTLDSHGADVFGLDLYEVMATRGCREVEVTVCHRRDLRLLPSLLRLHFH